MISLAPERIGSAASDECLDAATHHIGAAIEFSRQGGFSLAASLQLLEALRALHEERQAAAPHSKEAEIDQSEVD